MTVYIDVGVRTVYMSY